MGRNILTIILPQMSKIITKILNLLKFNLIEIQISRRLKFFALSYKLEIVFIFGNTDNTTKRITANKSKNHIEIC